MMKLHLKNYFYVFATLALAFGCKPDNFRPLVQTLIVDDVNTNEPSADTIFNVSFPIKSEYILTYNKGVEEYRFEFNRTNDTIPDLHFIELGKAGGVTEYTGFTTVNFDQSVLDTLPDNPGYYFISVDCFDLSGNVAFQRKVITQIIVK
jgi:hypothetical protein